MKMIRFRYRAQLGAGYSCSEPGDRGGEYVPAEVAADLLAALKRLMDVCRHLPDDPEFPTNATIHALAQAALAIERAESK